MRKIALIFLAIFIFSCDDEDNMVIQEETLPYANKTWYLVELGGEKPLVGANTAEEYETLQLNEGVTFNSYRIIQRVYADDNSGNQELINIPTNIGTWSVIEDNVLQLNYDIRVLGDIGNNMKIYIISYNNDEFVVDIEKNWLFQFDETTEENGGIYKVRARYVSSKD